MVCVNKVTIFHNFKVFRIRATNWHLSCNHILLMVEKLYDGQILQITLNYQYCPVAHIRPVMPK